MQTARIAGTPGSPDCTTTWRENASVMVEKQSVGAISSRASKGEVAYEEGSETMYVAPTPVGEDTVRSA